MRRPERNCPGIPDERPERNSCVIPDEKLGEQLSQYSR